MSGHVQLSMTADQRGCLLTHLFPGDGLEAAAVALCGRASGGDRHRLLVHDLVLIPYDQCQRAPDMLYWSTAALEPVLQRAERHSMAIVKFHSHPGGYSRFSPVDDRGDRDLFSSVHGWIADGAPHASVVMLPGGAMFGRAVLADGTFDPLERITVIGDELTTYLGDRGPASALAAEEASLQVFGAGTVAVLRRLRIGVVGVSGTGSLVVEQLARQSVGSLVLVDPDIVEPRNLNRIVGTRFADAAAGLSKVEVLAEHIATLGFGTEVRPHATRVNRAVAIRDLASCDVVIGCIDKVIPRALLNRLTTVYLQPYFDLGVRLDADGRGSVTAICGGIHYLQPGYSPLDARGVYTDKDLRAEGLLERDPTAYRSQLAGGYIHGASVASPSVISVNMQIASLAMVDLLARVHQFRTMGNAANSFIVNLGEFEIERRRFHERDTALAALIGRGDQRPLLGLPEVEL